MSSPSQHSQYAAVFDPDPFGWTVFSPISAPEGTLSPSLMPLSNGCLVGGGSRKNWNQNQSDLGFYDYSKQAWTPIQAPLSAGTTFIGAGDCVYFFDGTQLNSDGSLTALGYQGRLDLTTLTFHPLQTPMPLLRRYGARTLNFGDRLFVWGGFESNEAFEPPPACQNGYILNLDDESVVEVSALPSLRLDRLRGLFRHHQKAWVITEETIASYDLDRHKWHEFPLPVEYRQHHFTVTHYGNRLYVWGGADRPFSYGDFFKEDDDLGITHEHAPWLATYAKTGFCFDLTQETFEEFPFHAPDWMMAGWEVSLRASDSHLYFWGGHRFDSITEKHFVIRQGAQVNLQTGEWLKIDGPSALPDHRIPEVYLYHNQLILWSGRYLNGSNSMDWTPAQAEGWILSKDQTHWSPLKLPSMMPQNLTEFSSRWNGERLFVVGGQTDSKSLSQ